jgi:hypothetical protein
VLRPPEFARAPSGRLGYRAILCRITVLSELSANAMDDGPGSGKRPAEVRPNLHQQVCGKARW